MVNEVEQLHDRASALVTAIGPAHYQPAGEHAIAELALADFNAWFAENVRFKRGARLPIDTAFSRYRQAPLPKPQLSLEEFVRSMVKKAEATGENIGVLKDDRRRGFVGWELAAGGEQVGT